MADIYQAVWYRSKVKLSGTQIIPEPPFEDYNPFESYYSFQQGRRGRKSLYLEFLDVDVENSNAILNWCERFGVLGVRNPMVQDPMERLAFNFADSLGLPLVGPEENVRLDEWDPIPHLWNRISDHLEKLEIEEPDKALKERKLLFQMHRKLTRPNPEEIFVPMEIKDFVLTQRELKEATITHPSQECLTELSQINTKMGFINLKLSEASLSPNLQWDIQRGHAVLGWESHTLTGILYLMVMLDFLGSGNILTCPWCKKFFLSSSPRIRFCSPQCGNSFKVREHKIRKTSQVQKSSPKKSVSGVQSMPNKKRGEVAPFL